MARPGDYNLYITTLSDRFRINPDNLANLIDFLDTKLYLEGVDRDLSRLVPLSHKEGSSWEAYIRNSPDETFPPVRRRVVHPLYSPASKEINFKDFGDLIRQLDLLNPRDIPLVVSLGRTTRRFLQIFDCPVPGQAVSWIMGINLHIIDGVHPLWERYFNEEEGIKEWQLMAVKSFSLLASCKLNPRAEPMHFETYLNLLSSKPEFLEFMRKIGAIGGIRDFDLIGANTN